MHWSSSVLLYFASLAASQSTNTTTPPCKRCNETAHGFASLNGGTTGGNGGPTVFATTYQELRDYAARAGPLIIRINTTLTASPRGYEIPIASNKTIIGVGQNGKVSGGGFAIQGTRNIILRNLEVSDTRIPSDWPGKTEDWDGIQVDNGTNIWIDHMKFARMNDGLIDLRRDSTYITVSSTILSEHNKALGIGWTTNVTARITINDNFFNSTNARNPSADNIAQCHMYNNYFRNCTAYGTYARGNTSLLLENSYYDSTFDPVVAGPNATIRSSWIKFGKGVEGERTLSVRPEGVFRARDYYQYSLRDPYDLPNDIPYFAGPQEDVGS
ncbi:pectin lyase fold/virulence factor [Dendryphion nanum]|uniref:Pectin lyase fold/virulence factor n=1 Tax=Dendryphion nanum TaxID=256645 RepID=A0A9P9DZG7_9PLEO|nr:pectin lyase fold/virulence factor [Dendryphion nanum]